MTTSCSQFLRSTLLVISEGHIYTSQVIGGSSNVHPESVQRQGIQLVLRSHLRENFLLNGGGTSWNSLQDGGIQDVKAGVDAVADVGLWLLHELLDAASGVGKNNTVFGWLLHRSHHDGSLLAMSHVEVVELLEGEGAGHITVEDKERLIVIKVLLGEGNGSGSAHGLVLDGDDDVHAVLCLDLRGSLLQLFFQITDGKNNSRNTDLSQSLDLVVEDGSTRNHGRVRRRNTNCKTRQEAWAL